MKLYKYIVLALIALVPTLASAQESDPRLNTPDDKMMFNHLSIGGTVGINGIGVDVSMPCSKYVSLRGGISFLATGDIRHNFSTDAADVVAQIKLPDPRLEEALRNTNVELQVNAKMVNAHILAEIYPFIHSTFHFTAGFYAGNNRVLEAKNTKPGSLKFLYNANLCVEEYNRTFGTDYLPIGARFGDYILTADKNGNINAKMYTWPVRPYVGVGFGRCFGRTNKCSVLLDAGCMFWGTPKINLNGEEKVSTSSKNAGALAGLSKLCFFPVVQIRIAGDIF